MISSLFPTLLNVFTEKGATFWLPGPRSTMAKDIDYAWNAVWYVSLLFFFIVVGAMVLFVIRYRRRSTTDQVSTITHNTPIEIAWTLIPLIIVLWFFAIGFRTFISYDTPPSDAITIEAIASQWNFQFVYPGGGQSDVLYVPKGKTVRLNMTSKDVTHAFYAPNFRIGKNMIQGRVTQLWFEATQLSGPDGFPVYCTQYCGKSHSEMTTKVIVLEPEDYARKVVELANVFKDGDRYIPYAEVGEKLYRSNGCGTCHTTDGTDNTGPTWKGFWTRDHEFSTTNEPGYVLKAADPDEKKIKYVAESIIAPKVKIVKDRPDQMQPYASFGDNAAASPDKEYAEYYKYQKTLAIVEYLKKLSEDPQHPYDPSKAPKFREPSGTAATPATATDTQPATTTSPNGK